MNNWEIGAKIEGENLDNLLDDAIVWIEWVDGLAGPVMMEDFREQGSTGGTVYNLTVTAASVEAIIDDHEAKWDALPEEEKQRWLDITEY